MELTLKEPCPACGGSLVEKGFFPTEGEQGTVWEERECYCVQTDCPGYKVVGTIDITDLDDKLNDILDKCNDIFEKVSE